MQSAHPQYATGPADVQEQILKEVRAIKTMVLIFLILTIAGIVVASLAMNA